MLTPSMIFCADLSQGRPIISAVFAAFTRKYLRSLAVFLANNCVPCLLYQQISALLPLLPARAAEENSEFLSLIGDASLHSEASLKIIIYSLGPSCHFPRCITFG
jgi:hypothetical protein